MKHAPTFSVWKSITVGTYIDTDTLSRALLEAGFHIQVDKDRPWESPY